jgi:hypothetical protein
MEEHFISAHDGDQRQVVALAKRDLFEGLADERGRQLDLGDPVAGANIQIIDDGSCHQRVGDANTRFEFWEDDAVRADALQDLGVLGRVRLGDDVATAALAQVERRQDARLHVRADGDHRGVELVHAELPQRVGIGGVGGDRVGHGVSDALDKLGIDIDGQHVVANLIEGARDRCSEASQSDDEDLLGHVPPNQPESHLLRAECAPSGRARRG